MTPERQKQNAILELFAMLRLWFENQIRNVQQLQDQRSVVSALENQISALLTQLDEEKTHDQKIIRQLKSQLDCQQCELDTARRQHFPMLILMAISQ